MVESALSIRLICKGWGLIGRIGGAKDFVLALLTNERLGFVR